MRDTIEHTGKAFLGLTLQCARCHDHKYDPISQLDYFRFRPRRLDVPGRKRLKIDHGKPITAILA